MLRTMMKKSCDKCLLKVVLPIFIIISVHIKQNLFSFCYLLMFFFVPWLKTYPTKTSNKVGVCWFLVLASTLTCLIVMAQFCFQGVCFFLKCNFSNMSCDSFEQWIQQIGFVDWRTSGTLQILGSVVPDLLLLVTLIEILRRYIRSDSKNVGHFLTGEQYEKLMAAEKLSAALLLAAAAAVCRPSAAGALYLVCAQAAGVAWACRWQRRFFAWPPLGALLLVQAVHITALLAAHTPWGRRALPPTLAWCFNLTALTEVNCSSPVEVLYRDVAWEAYVTPVILLTLYAVTGNLMHHTLIKRPKAEHVELAQRLGWHQLAPKLRPRAGSQWYRIVFDAFKTFVYEKYLDEGLSILACIVMMN